VTQLLPPNLDYTDKDFDSLRKRLIDLIQSVFPQWTDFNVANFGNILMELNAFVGDTLIFYQDNQAKESRIVTATQRKNLIGLAKLLGFEPKTASAAQVEVDFSIPAIESEDVTISATTTRVRTVEVVEPVAYQLLADVVIPAGQTTAQATVENSERRKDVFVSDGSANQEFRLSGTPYLDESAEALAADGAYFEVDSFLSSEPGDLHFTVTVDENDQAVVRFGNGTSGKIPVGSITFDYKTGGGADGNVEPGEVRVIEPSSHLVGNGPDTVTVSVNNAALASGGAPRQSVSQIQQAAPESLRVLNRAVAREDFEIVARGVSGVARALHITANEDAGVPENTGLLFVIPDGGGTPTQLLKDTVAAQFDRVVRATLGLEGSPPFPKLNTYQLVVSDAAFLVVDVAARVFFRDGVTPATGAASIRSTLADYFALTTVDPDTGALLTNPNVDFGFNFKDVTGQPAGELAWSDIFNAVRDDANVRKVGALNGDFTLNEQQADVVITSREFPTLGTVALIDGDTGLSV
jgi:hypothetical protein